jgi:hypothetical protein
MGTRQLVRRVRHAAVAVKTPQYAAPGHFYSPVSTSEDRERALSPWPLVGIDLRDEAQDAYVAAFPHEWTTPRWHRYQPRNNMFAEGDAAFYAAVLRAEQPGRVMEIGGGWSTAVAVDVRDTSLPRLQISCVEPYPERLRQALGPDLSVTLRQQSAQDVPWGEFAELRAGDILFIDSTHVVKPGCDVTRLLLDVMPRLPVGVLVHVHDIFDGFELPEPWLHEGRDWAETYLLRAFLTHNASWEIVVFTARLWGRHAWLRNAFPAGTLGPDGIWLRRIS